jgi:uncharacterized protein YecE (DUF72 family)
LRYSETVPRPDLRIGCSGWQYRDWRGNFYPEDLRQARWFEYYATRFDTVEINSSFYRLPERETFARWRGSAPKGFLFAVKASRYLTHMKKLKDPAEPLERLFANVRALGSRLGPVLYQLPPHWTCDVRRLDAFLDLLPRDVLQAVEFRDPSWYGDDTFDTLERHGVSLCLHDMRGPASPRLAVGPFVYVRFHGSGPRYGGAYPDSTLADWSEWLAAQRTRGLSVYAYFNNDVGGHAPKDAARLRRFVEPSGPSQNTRRNRTRISTSKTIR